MRHPGSTHPEQHVPSSTRGTHESRTRRTHLTRIPTEATAFLATHARAYLYVLDSAGKVRGWPMMTIGRLIF